MVSRSVALVKSLDPTRPVNAISGSSAGQQALVQSVVGSNVQDMHTDGEPTFQGKPL